MQMSFFPFCYNNFLLPPKNSEADHINAVEITQGIDSTGSSSLEKENKGTM